DRGERDVRRDEIADLRLRDAGDAVDERGDFRKFQIELRLRDLGLRGGDRRLVAEVRLDGVVKLLLAYDLIFGQRRETFDVDLGLAERRFGLLQLPYRLIERRLVGTGIDFE